MAVCLAFILNAQTSVEDYNYITRGYADDINNGRGIKTGYNVSVFSTGESVKWADGTERYITLSYFKKGADKKAIIVACSDKNGTTKKWNVSYHCIPTLSSSDYVWQQYYFDMSDWDSNWKLTMCWALSKVLSEKLL